MESEPRPTCSTVNTPLGLPNLNLRVTPEMARPFPKASGNTKKNNNKKIVKSEVLTDTPVTNRIEMETLERGKKKKIVKGRKNKQVNLKKNKKIFVKKLSLRSKDLGSSEVGEEWVESDSNDDLDIDISEEDEEEEEHQNINANVGDFLLVEVCGKRKETSITM